MCILISMHATYLPKLVVKAAIYLTLDDTMETKMFGFYSCFNSFGLTNYAIVTFLAYLR